MAVLTEIAIVDHASFFFKLQHLDKSAWIRHPDQSSVFVREWRNTANRFCEHKRFLKTCHFSQADVSELSPS
jgi:hypothetical protein